MMNWIVKKYNRESCHERLSSSRKRESSELPLHWIAVYTGMTKMKAGMTLLLLIFSNIACHFVPPTKIEQLQKYAQTLPEYPKPDNEDLLNPDYASFYEKDTSLLFGFSWLQKFNSKNKIVDSFYELLSKELGQRQKDVPAGDYVALLQLPSNSRVFLWGDVQGAFHSLVRTMSHLHQTQVLDVNFKITNPNDYFIFNGDLIDRSAYNIETLYVVLLLLQQNPKQVFYVQGNHENNRYWLDYGLKTEVNIRAKHLQRNGFVVLQSLESFFATLPQEVLITAQQKNLRDFISIIHVNEDSLLPYLNLTQIQTDDKIIYLKPDKNNLFENANRKISVFFKGESRSKNYQITSGLTLTSSQDSASVWTLLSSPTYVYNQLYGFYNDAFALIEMQQELYESTISQFTQDAQNPSGFKEKKLNLITGSSADIKLPAQFYENRVRVGVTLDLSRDSRIIGERLKNGIDLYKRKANQLAHINGQVDIYFADDKHSPSLSLKNVRAFIENFKAQAILSTVGTSTASALLPSLRQNNMILFFPYSGSTLFRKPEEKSVINFRTSFANEANALVDYAVSKLFKRKFAIFYQDDISGNESMQAAQKRLLNHHNMSSERVCLASHPANSVNITQAVKIISDCAPDTLILFTKYAAAKNLIDTLRVDTISNATILANSYLSDKFRDYVSGSNALNQIGKGFEMIITRVVPNPNSSPIEIVKQFQEDMKKNFPGALLDPDTLEGYINVSVLMHFLKKAPPEYPMQTAMQRMENTKNYDFKGLILNFDPKTRELFHGLWLDIGDDKWIDVSH